MGFLFPTIPAECKASVTQYRTVTKPATDCMTQVDKNMMPSMPFLLTPTPSDQALQDWTNKYTKDRYNCVCKPYVLSAFDSVVRACSSVMPSYLAFATSFFAGCNGDVASTPSLNKNALLGSTTSAGTGNNPFEMLAQTMSGTDSQNGGVSSAGLSNNKNAAATSGGLSNNNNAAATSGGLSNGGSNINANINNITKPGVGMPTNNGSVPTSNGSVQANNGNGTSSSLRNVNPDTASLQNGLGATKSSSSPSLKKTKTFVVSMLATFFLILFS
jgi:hypothetical protein